MNKRLLLNIIIITILLMMTLSVGTQASPDEGNDFFPITTRVSVASDGTQGNDESHSPSLSADGRFVAFDSEANNLVIGDTNGYDDVFVHDRQTGITTMVSVASDGTQWGGIDPSISADGRFVAFTSDSVFVHDRQTGTTTCVSVASDGTLANDPSYGPSISADGRYVAFVSYATNLVSEDTNGYRDIFVHDQQTDTTTRVSVASDGTQANDNSRFPSISADGRYVAFESDATNLADGDTNGYSDIFVHDQQTGTTTRVSVASDGTQASRNSYYPSISVDGSFVTFSSSATNLVGGDTNGYEDIFVHNLQTSATTLVSVASDGSQGNGSSWGAYISTDGRYVAFVSEANNLVIGDTNGFEDIFVHDLQTSATTLVSVASDGTQGNDSSWDTTISKDGRYIAIVSYATNLVSGDTNGQEDIFLHDRGGPPSLAINYTNGAPGSYFNITGSDYPPNENASVSINGNSLGEIATSATGTFTITLSTGNADEGDYEVTVSVNPEATTQFTLDASDPTRPQEGTYKIFDVPAGIIFTNKIYLPEVVK